MPLAVYSMIRGAAAIALSSWVGSYIDRNDRLKTVRLSIGKAIHAIRDITVNIGSISKTGRYSLMCDLSCSHQSSNYAS